MPTFEIDVDPHLREMLEQADDDTIRSCLEEVAKRATDAQEKRDELHRKRKGHDTEELEREYATVGEVYADLDAGKIDEATAKQHELRLKRDDGGAARKGL